jgi:hypothetical protein
LKKILIISMILGMVLSVKSFAQVGANFGPVKFQVGINQFPGKNYWWEDLYRWQGGVWQEKRSQNEESFHVTLLSVRASTMKPILSPNLSGGLEVGCEIPISSWKKKWENGAGDTLVGEPPEYTEMEWEFFGLGEPDVDYTSSLELKERLVVVPILGKLAYTADGRTKVGIGLSFGAYVVNSQITGTMTKTYAQNSGLYVKGEKETTETTVSGTTCSPGGEFSVDLSLPVSDIFSIGFNGWAGYIGKATIFWGGEWTEYTQTEWSPAAREMSTLKQVFEVGGLSYGGGLSFNLFF